jgi:homoserine O-acetyltransferase
MKPNRALQVVVLLMLATAAFAQAPRPAQDFPRPTGEGEYVVPEYQFNSGERLTDLKLHYYTYGQPRQDAHGRTTNAVLILHGTGGSGLQFVRPQFAGVLFGPGQLLDAAKYFIILPDNVGHGKSSKPSDSLHAKFPHYDYDDMVALQHRLLTDKLGVNHLRLVMGTSMGCMHSWIWLETYPDFMDGAVPLACEPVEIAGRNRMMRKMAMDSIMQDPAWERGEYKQQPPGLRGALEMLLIMGSSPLQMQKNFPTRQQADAYLEQFLSNGMRHYDANDFLYQFASSRNYDPWPKLAQVKAPVLMINSADDFINPPELDDMAREAVQKIPKGRFILLPVTDQTRGHGTHTLPAVWGKYLDEFVRELPAR